VKPASRASLLLTGTLVVAAVLTGCRTSPGAAALVGDDRISTETLQSQVQQALADPQAEAALGNDRAAFARTELGRLINNAIVASAAARHHITVSQSKSGPAR